MPTGVNWVLNPDGSPGESWNPVVGCSPAILNGRPSPACAHCYAARLASTRLKHRPLYAGLTDGAGQWTGRVRLVEGRLEQPLHWKKPRGIFVCDMADLFHPKVPLSFVAEVFDKIDCTPQHTYYVLTKRPDRMVEFFEAPGDWAKHPNVWAGVTVENQEAADERIPKLLACRPYVGGLYLSCEPLLGAVRLPDRCYHDSDYPSSCILDWVIAGGETGPKARPSHPDYFRKLRDDCAAAGVPFFFKAWGGYNDRGVRVGKKRAGRLLDGVEHNGTPWEE